MIEDMSDFCALDPFFRAIEPITVPNYPGHVVRRADLSELYRG